MTAPIEMWGGIECTVNRVGDVRIDQLELSGHATRASDLERMAALGIRTWRYPLLWERVAPAALENADWRWSDRRMARLRELGLDPIVGLLHHGSGPWATSLVDPSFPELFAVHARAAAERYPWVRRWTPINEPLSTARFSALDGHWFPHATSNAAFARALVNQCRAIRLAMVEIRREIPDAELVLTEDVCRQSHTPGMRAEAEFRNERRWLGIDLVCGRVSPDHPFWAWLVGQGIAPSELELLADAPIPPAILGANYYVTSDRLLDDDADRHVPHRRFPGPEGPYAETESVRHVASGLSGHRTVLLDLWERYGLPVALTEVHLGCTREEQVRWLLEAWDAAHLARQDGADVRAITAWGAFGLFGWDHLVTRAGGAYEPGLFDVRGPRPRLTAVGRVASDLAAGRPPAAPYGGTGWWRRPIRLLDRPSIDAAGAGPERAAPAPRPSRPLLVTGAGALAREVGRACELRGLAVVMPGRSLDVTDAEAVRATLDAVRPWGVFHAAGVRSRSDAELDPDRCLRLHAGSPAVIGAACAERAIRLVHLSSSLVLSGPGPCDESAPVRPRSVLGEAQAEGERRAVRAHPRALVLRCGHVVGLDRTDDLLAAGLAALAHRRVWTVQDGAAVVLASSLVSIALDLLADGERGVWHVAHRRSWFDLARAAAALAGFAPTDVRLAPAADAVRLATVRGHLLPPCSVPLRERIARLGPPSSPRLEMEAS